MLKFHKLLPLVALTFLSSVAIVRSQQLQTPTNAYTQKVTREVLASGSPTEVQGRVLELVKYTIPPNSKLPVHIHPGMQIERVESGTLTYTVVKGSAKITRSNGKEEMLEAGQTTRLNVGDALVEVGGMVHYGENETDNPVILLSASLFEEGKPKAILINP
ncbi:cupin domain-containing protein [Planktothrix sp. FACHB-1365]|uniref:cupin domain-containing protein n=1 Tax=Planktothrix sp. FACHB-1365 TaxID=2692855 RepID=UPI001687D3C7|nr:cupin domain-containing protein [Planktothrix sp. FACHB-1365]MBD2480754.1 cupin domain-containing protein [Planktothrix sp. FACHB-1365]